MFIYKIICDKNNKVYVGQTTTKLEVRLNRHFIDSAKLDTKFARAIKKYGRESFGIELIETVSEIDNLNEREIFWIKELDTLRYGYNSTNGGEGGNTYLNKTATEMDIINERISKTKLGSLNPNSRKVKFKNVISGVEHKFDSIKEAQDFFGETNHNFITRRVTFRTKYCYKGEWLISYLEDNYTKDYSINKGANYKRSKQVIIINTDTEEEEIFPTYTSAEKSLGLPRGVISKTKLSNLDSYKQFQFNFQ